MNAKYCWRLRQLGASNLALQHDVKCLMLDMPCMFASYQQNNLLARLPCLEVRNSDKREGQLRVVVRVGNVLVPENGS